MSEDDSKNTEDISTPLGYTITPDSTMLLNSANSFEKLIQIGILCLSLVILLLHIVVGLSMTNTIFLFVMYGILLLFIMYLKNKYIKKIA
jgi:hypothetical protein